MGRIGASLSGTQRLLLNRLAEAEAATTLSNRRLSAEVRTNGRIETDTVAETLPRDKNQAFAQSAVASLAILDQQRLRIVELMQNLAGF